MDGLFALDIQGHEGATDAGNPVVSIEVTGVSHRRFVPVIYIGLSIFSLSRIAFDKSPRTRNLSSIISRVRFIRQSLYHFVKACTGYRCYIIQHIDSIMIFIGGDEMKSTG